jgi:hypothetical protein
MAGHIVNIKSGRTTEWHRQRAQEHFGKASPHLLRAVEHMRLAGTLNPSIEAVVSVLTAQYRRELAHSEAVVPQKVG